MNYGKRVNSGKREGKDEQWNDTSKRNTMRNGTKENERRKTKKQNRELKINNKE